jgi:anti-anti-sigma regulatory factor
VYGLPPSDQNLPTPLSRSRMVISPGVVNLVGDFDFSNRLDVRAILDQIRDPATIDLSQTTFIDAAIIAEFIRLTRRLAPRKLALAGMSSHMLRLFDMLELDELMLYGRVL